MNIKLRIFIGSIVFAERMTLKLRCKDYGFECDFVLDGAKNIALLEKLREHFAEEHGIDYTREVITQMIVNRGHSLDSIQKE